MLSRQFKDITLSMAEIEKSILEVHRNLLGITNGSYAIGLSGLAKDSFLSLFKQ